MLMCHNEEEPVSDKSREGFYRKREQPVVYAEQTKFKLVDRCIGP